MGILCLLFAAWITWQTTLIPERMVSNEPGPRMFPYISAAGIAVFAILSMVYGGPKETGQPYLDRAGWKRMFLILGEVLGFCIAMEFIGFWFASMVGMLVFIWTLKGEKKIQVPFAVALAAIVGSVCYFGFTRGFHIPLPSGSLWRALGIRML